MPNTVTGRCYCGASTIRSVSAPQIKAYCHCEDCRRWTGSPLPAFAGFALQDIAILPKSEGRVFPSGVRRWFCEACGSPLAAEFPYLPGQIYVPLGVLDQAADLKPELHAHSVAGMPWLHLEDGLARTEGSSRESLLKATP